MSSSTITSAVFSLSNKKTGAVQAQLWGFDGLLLCANFKQDGLCHRSKPPGRS
jgi:hypothetical protein